MTWANSVRERRKARRRADWHQGRIDTADTAKKRLLAACNWLVSEAWKAGRTDDVFEYVITKVHDLREGAGDDRSDDYAA